MGDTDAALSAQTPASPSLKALIVDDFYARPTAAEVRRFTNAFRQFITDNAESGLKEWLDQCFGLSGDHWRAGYFDPMLETPDRVQRFWSMRDTSPVGESLSNEVFNALVDELRPAYQSLRNIEDQLRTNGWVVQPKAALPPVESVDVDISLIVIDYILVPGEPAGGLEASTDFLRKVIDQAKNSAADTCPFVLLISENPDAERDAETFRQSVKVYSPYFRFVRKAALSKDEIERIVTNFQMQREELESYRKLHIKLMSSVKTATEELVGSVKELELQDLATLHAGQLVQEGEPLSDYLGWLYGQYLSAKMIQHKELAERSAELPTSSYKVLLGHLHATDNIPKLFSGLSLPIPASGASSKVLHGRLQIRFGDLFSYQAELPQADADEEEPVLAKEAGRPYPLVERYLLVISQTCDLFHHNITNGQVLCLDGDAHPIQNTEADMVRATIRQMDQQGRVLLKEGARFVEVEWHTKDVRTVEEEKLATEGGYEYLGRLNEVYALQAQHNALDELGRIGVPIQPSYSIFFNKLTLKVFEGENEVADLRAESDSDMILAVLRNEKAHVPVGAKPKKSKHRLLFSAEIRNWLIAKLTALSSAPALPGQLKLHVDRLRDDLNQRSDFSLIVKVQKESVASFALEKLTQDGKIDSSDPKDLTGMIAVELKDVFEAPSRSNTRLELVFEKI